MESFSGFPAPQKSDLPFSPWKSLLELSGNPNLETCSNEFICNLVQNNPDSVIITNNGTYCEFDSLNTIGCITVSNQHTQPELVEIIPSPASTHISITDFDDGEYMIYSVQGSLLEEGAVQDGSIRIEHLTPGNYFLWIKGDDSTAVGKFIKQ